MLPKVPLVTILPAPMLPVYVGRYAAILAFALVTMLLICVCCVAALALENV